MGVVDLCSRWATNDLKDVIGSCNHGHGKDVDYSV